MTTYQATAKRWEHGWELHIDGVGVTQCTGLTGAERAARDYLAIVIGGDPAPFDVEIAPELDEEIGDRPAVLCARLGLCPPVWVTCCSPGRR